MRLVLISDTHGMLDQLELPEGDLLVHAGDVSAHGAMKELVKFDQDLAAIRARYTHGVVFCVGNHDFAFEHHPVEAQACITNAVYLQDREVTVGGLRIYGAPWQPRFRDWAFNLDRGTQLQGKWQQIPAGLDILITHGPPLGHGDRVTDPQPAPWRIPATDPRSVGCADLAREVLQKQPRVHVFGHIHEDYGMWETATTLYVNASTCNRAYRPINPPVVLDFGLVQSTVLRS